MKRLLLPLMLCSLLTLFCACTATRVELIRDGEFHTLRPPVSHPGYRKGKLNVIRPISPVK